MKKLDSGFTLIELVVALTIIAILAAVALPRYISLQSQARAAKLSAIYGSVKSAAALAKAKKDLAVIDRQVQVYSLYGSELRSVLEITRKP